MYQQPNRSPYKDARHQNPAGQLSIGDILQDEITCTERMGNGETRDARRRNVGVGRHICMTLRPGLQYISCDMDMAPRFDLTMNAPAFACLSALFSGHSAMQVERAHYIHPSDGTPHIMGLGQETELRASETTDERVKMSGVMFTKDFFEHLPPDLAAAFSPLTTLLEPGARCHALNRSPMLRQLLARLQDIPFHGCLARLHAESLATAALIELVGTLEGTPPTCPQAQKRKHHLANEARARINDAPERIASAQALAHELGTNETTLRACFREVHGISLMDHVRDVRLDRARTEIRFGLRPVSQIAYDCGYSHPANFTHAYRKRFGCAPRADRQDAGVS